MRAAEASLRLKIIHATLIHVLPNRVYQALMPTQGLDAWFARGTHLETCPGGKIQFRWVNCGPDHTTSQDDEAAQRASPGKRFNFHWHPYSPNNATTVDLKLTSADGGTIVSLRE